MPIYKHPKSTVWWLDIRAPGGERIRRSTGTEDKKAAQEYHDTVRAELWRRQRLGEAPDHYFEEGAVRFLDASSGQRDYETKLRHVEYWREQFAGRTLRSLTADEIIAGLPTHSSHRDTRGRPLTGATKNRYLATIRRLLNVCADLNWLDKVPKLGTYEEPDVRVRWEPPSVIGALIQAMRLPWMRDASLVAVSTGMREGELFSLRPNRIDLPQRNAWVTHEGAKSGRARTVPLNDDACQVIERRLAKAQKLVFTRGDDLDTLIQQNDRRDFARACKVVGIEDFHFHDLRHTWASWHVQRGTPLMVLKELGGWETIEMVQKYAHLAPSHLAHHADTVEFWTRFGHTDAPPIKTPPLGMALVA